MIMHARRPRGSRPLAASAPMLALVAAVFLAGCGGGDKKQITVPPQAPVVQVLAPNGGESFLVGTSTEITWSATDGDTPSNNLLVTIEFSADAGTSWFPVASNEQNDGTFSWAVPGTATAQALIRVTATDGVNRGNDVSDTPFAITSTPPPPRNTIGAGDVSGAPGATVDVPLSLWNQDTAGLVEARIWFDKVVGEFVAAELTGRGTGMQAIAVALAADTVKITVQQRGGVVLAPGSGPIALLRFRLIGAGGTDTELRLRQARFLDPSGTARSVRALNGSLTVLLVDTPGTLTAAGWIAFQAGNLDLALQKFDAAIGLDAQYGPAYTGRGWVQLSRATTPATFQAAGSSFDDAVGHGQTGADTRGGRAAVRLALGGSGLGEAVGDAQAALDSSPTFVFPHRTSFDFRDLHLIAAFAEAGRGSFTNARDEANRVQPSGITQGDQDSWVVDGVRYATFEAAVLAWLHKMSAAFAG
jgi:hypothetical protein